MNCILSIYKKFGSLKGWSDILATIVSRALQPQDRKIPYPVDRNLEIFLTSHIDFDNVQIMVNYIVSEKKSKGHQTSKIVKSTQSSCNGPSALLLFILVLSTRAQCMTWHVDLRAQQGDWKAFPLYIANKLYYQPSIVTCPVSCQWRSWRQVHCLLTVCG